jgi:hypothetical protein
MQKQLTVINTYLLPRYPDSLERKVWTSVIPQYSKSLDPSAMELEEGWTFRRYGPVGGN